MKIIKTLILFLSVLILFQCDKKKRSQIGKDKNLKKITEEKEISILKKEIFEKKNHSVLDSKIKEQEFLKLSNTELNTIFDILKNKKNLNQANYYNLAITSFLKESNYSAKMKNDNIDSIKKKKIDQNYGEKEFSAELPLEIFGDCAGKGFSYGNPNVMINKDGTLKGFIETNTTLENYSGTWKISDGLLIFDFTVKVEETGDMGDSGKVKTLKFDNQKTVIIDNTKIYGLNGQQCTIYRKDIYLTESLKGKNYLLKNKKKNGVITTKSGLQYEILKTGNGPKPNASDIVKVHYKGTFVDGTEFDSSYKRNAPTSFPLNKVIKGWIEGIQLMNTGSKYKFTIPSSLGYGSKGRAPIPGRSVLIFEVELLEIVK